MQTRCPACQTLFRLPLEQVVLSRGEVRCGECHATFNSIDHLVTPTGERIPRLTLTNIVFDTPANRHALPERIFLPIDESVIASLLQDEQSRADPRSPPPQLTPIRPHNAFTLVEPEMLQAEDDRVEERQKDHPATQNDVVPPPLVVPTSPTQPYQRLQRRRWVRHPSPLRLLGQLLLLLGLAALLGFQYLYAQQHFFSQQPLTRPILERGCRWIGCRIDPRRDLAALELQYHPSLSHPHRDHALIIRATIHNRAPFAQPYPQLELSLLDTQGAVLRHPDGRPLIRLFTPEEYRLGWQSRSRLEPYGMVEIALEIADNSATNTGFKLELRP